MYQDYINFYTKYTAEYGSKVAIFIQVGSFYELYDIQRENGTTEMNVKEIVDFLGIQLTIKRGDAPGGLDGLFAGFPDYVLHKWAGKLTAAGWTVIVVNQYKDKQGKVNERKVARILSPATHIEALATDSAPVIVGLWVQTCTGQAPQYAAATFDLSTGSTYTTEGEFRGTSAAFTSDELLHFLSVFNPRELVVYSNTGSVDFWRKQLDFSNPANTLHVRSVAQGSFEAPEPREAYLRRLYAPKSLLPIKQYLHLNSTLIELALCFLLRHVEDYQPSAFTSLQQNKTWSPTSMLLLGNHALNQLQIIAEGSGVLDLFKYTATAPFSKRALRTRLLTPSADPTVIEERLREVDTMKALPSQTIKGIYKGLRQIYDLPRLHRKMVCATITAADILALQSSYNGAIDVLRLLERPYTQECLNALENLFDLEKAAANSENKTWLPSADHPTLATLENALESAREQLEQYLIVLKDIAATENGIRYEAKEKTPYELRGTKTALTILKSAVDTPAAKKLKALPKEQQEFSVHLQKGGGYIESSWVNSMNAKIIGLRDKLQTEFALILPTVCDRFCQATSALWSELEDAITSIDISVGLASEATSRNWCRPTITVNNEGSTLKGEGLRHPLIEGLLTRTEYVAHDVELASNGWLVYGMNASGKSSLMKSVGIAVHLAQAGCYVPATSFILAPYRSLFTRILNQDNLWAGLSSFAVEMSEMRDILRLADRHSIVLGDELCSGTESVSATALVAAGIEWFAERGCSYIFATHLHELPKALPPPAELNLKVWHLKVAYDPYTGKLVYHRNLTEGQGSSLYGLEVARAMDVPLTFLDKAHQIRRRLLGVAADEEAPISAWNSAITRKACELCGCAITSALEVHHIKPRAEGGSNKASNLMVLCAGCHDKHHAAPEESPASNSFILTSEGLERIPQQTAPKSKKKGLSDEDKQTIEAMLLKFPNLPIKQIAFRLKHQEGIDVSEATIRKVKNC
jgi:DNA mismatch repair protein MutS